MDLRPFFTCKQALNLSSEYLFVRVSASHKFWNVLFPFVQYSPAVCSTNSYCLGLAELWTWFQIFSHWTAPPPGFACSCEFDFPPCDDSLSLCRRSCAAQTAARHFVMTGTWGGWGWTHAALTWQKHAGIASVTVVTRGRRTKGLKS